MNQKNLIGLPVSIADALAGDFDGNEYDIVPCQGLSAVKAMVTEESKGHIPNPKPPKIFTPRTQTGNYEKILKLRKPLLEKWVTIANVFYYLSAKYQSDFIEKIVKDHRLKSLLGESWKDNLNISPEKVNDKAIVIAEIQLGIKYGEDSYKTKVDIDSLIRRAAEYEAALRDYNKDLSIPYGKGLKKRMLAVLNNNGSTEELTSAFSLAFEKPKSTNIMDKVHRGLIRFFNDSSVHTINNSDVYISDDENDTVIPVQKTALYCCINSS